VGQTRKIGWPPERLAGLLSKFFTSLHIVVHEFLKRDGGRGFTRMNPPPARIDRGLKAAADPAAKA
jgi:hypothetical protein